MDHVWYAWTIAYLWVFSCDVVRKNLDEFITHLFSGCINPCLVVGILREKRYPYPNLRNFEYIDKFKESLKILLNPESWERDNILTYLSQYSVMINVIFNIFVKFCFNQ